MQTRKSFQLSILTAALLATVPVVSSAGDTYKIEHDGQSLIWYFNGKSQGSVEGNFNNDELKKQSNNTVNVQLNGNTFAGIINGGHVDKYIQNSNGTYTHTPAGNNIVTITNSVVKDVYGGYAKYADANNNTVKLEDSFNNVQIANLNKYYGGYTDDYHTVGNDQVFGNANNNKVIVNNSGANLDYASYGPSVYDANAYRAGATNGNSVTVTNSKVREVWGAYNFQGNHRGGANNNTVTVTNSEVYNGVAGAEVAHNYVSANNNTVTVTNSKSGVVYGARSWGEDAASTNNNTVTFDNSNTYNHIYGGWSLSNADKNSVVVKGDSSTQDVYGAFADDDFANNNSVSIEDNSYIDGDVYGGYGGSEATGNTVSIKGNSHIDGNVYGGYYRGNNRPNNGKDASGNTIIISSQYAAKGSKEAANGEYTIDEGWYGGNVYGGYSYNSGSGNLTDNNTVTFTGGQTLFGSIYGGNRTTTGNTLNLGESATKPLSNTVTAKNVFNFENINVYLPSSVKNGFTALQLTGTEETDLKQTNVNAYLQNAKGLTADSKIHLIQTAGTLTAPKNNGAAQNNVKVDIAGLINVIGKVQLTDNKNLDLTFSGDTAPVDPTPVDPTPVDPTPVDPTPVDPTPVDPTPVDPTPVDPTPVDPTPVDPTPVDPTPVDPTPVDPTPVDPTPVDPTPKPTPTAGENSKLLLENKLSLAAMLNSSSDTLTDNITQNANAHGSDSVYTFGSIGGGNKRTETGSHVTVKGFNLNAGVGANNEIGSGSLNSGVFLEYGRSDFKTHLDNEATSQGDAYYYGAGAYTRYTLSGFYGEGSLRGGKVKTKHDAGIWESYKLSNNYIGAHIGVGKQFAFGNNELDLYARYHYLHTNGNDFEVNGVKVKTDSVNSKRVKVGAKDTIKFTDNHAMYVGGAYQYAFKANANGTVSAVGQTAEIVSPKLKGSTGIGELGYTYKAGGIQVSIGATGYVGKEKGIGANAEFKYTF